MPCIDCIIYKQYQFCPRCGTKIGTENCIIKKEKEDIPPQANKNEDYHYLISCEYLPNRKILQLNVAYLLKKRSFDNYCHSVVIEKFYLESDRIYINEKLNLWSQRGGASLFQLTLNEKEVQNLLKENHKILLKKDDKGEHLGF